MRARLKRLVRAQKGTSAAEYALILAIVGSALAVASIVLGNTIANSLNYSSSQITDCGGQC